MDCTLDITPQGPSVNIVWRSVSTLSHVLKSKYGVVLINGVGLEGDPLLGNKQPGVPEKRSTHSLSSGVKVSVWRNDLTNVRADAVVNAANTMLQHYGGLALALSKAGGEQIQKDSDNYILLHGELKTGDAVITDAGLLPCKNIIHAVGPRLPPHPSKAEVTKAEPLLKKAIRNVLDRVQENYLKTVAIPALSSGLFHFPLSQCANILVSTVKDYCENSRGHLPKEILLVSNDKACVQEMERACGEILSHGQPMSYSQAAAANTSTPSVHLGRVRLTLHLGHIELQQTDVIVNTVSSTRTLSDGMVSHALSKKAGGKLQKELNRASFQGQIIVTAGYDLQCKEVYHTFCTDQGNAATEQFLYSSVLDCLWTADGHRHKSITFPAIGTRALCFSKQQIAKIMLEAVADFAKHSRAELEINFVIFPSAKDTYKAFEEVMSCLQGKASHPNFTPASEQYQDKSTYVKPRSPQISLRGPSEESTREAKRWLDRLLQPLDGALTIRNNFILHFGELEFQQLTRLGLRIEESFQKGHAVIKVTGRSGEEVAEAGLKVEAMLCNIQGAFVHEEGQAMFRTLNQNVAERKIIKPGDWTFSSRSSDFKKEGLCICRLEEVENAALNAMFDLKKHQLQCFTPRKMFQRIPAHFCEMVTRIGFHAVCAPPADPAYGEGIYFCGKVSEAMQVWKEPHQEEEEYLYFVEAEVLTGNSTPGKPGLILPHGVGTTSTRMYNSFHGGADVSVIFSSYQALPKYIITCKVN